MYARNKPGVCNKTTIANNRAGGSGDSPDVPYANGNSKSSKGNNNLMMGQPYTINIDGKIPTSDMVAAQAALRAAKARGGYRDVKGKFHLQQK